MAAAVIAESAVGSAIAESATESSGVKRLFSDTVGAVANEASSILEAGGDEVGQLAKRIKNTFIRTFDTSKPTKRKNVKYVQSVPKRSKQAYRHPQHIQREIALARRDHKANMNWFRAYSANRNTIGGRFAPVGDRSYYREPVYRYVYHSYRAYPYTKRGRNQYGHVYFRRRWKHKWYRKKKFVHWKF